MRWQKSESGFWVPTPVGNGWTKLWEAALTAGQDTAVAVLIREDVVGWHRVPAAQRPF